MAGEEAKGGKGKGAKGTQLVIENLALCAARQYDLGQEAGFNKGFGKGKLEGLREGYEMATGTFDSLKKAHQMATDLLDKKVQES